MQTQPAIQEVNMKIQRFRLADMKKKPAATMPDENRAMPEKRTHQVVIPYYPPVQMPPEANSYIKGADSICW